MTLELPPTLVTFHFLVFGLIPIIIMGIKYNVYNSNLSSSAGGTS
jgi:hypothetical protein